MRGRSLDMMSVGGMVAEVVFRRLSRPTYHIQYIHFLLILIRRSYTSVLFIHAWFWKGCRRGHWRARRAHYQGGIWVFKTATDHNTGSHSKMHD